MQEQGYEAVEVDALTVEALQLVARNRGLGVRDLGGEAVACFLAAVDRCGDDDAAEVSISISITTEGPRQLIPLSVPREAYEAIAVLAERNGLACRHLVEGAIDQFLAGRLAGAAQMTQAA